MDKYPSHLSTLEWIDQPSYNRTTIDADSPTARDLQGVVNASLARVNEVTGTYGLELHASLTALGKHELHRLRAIKSLKDAEETALSAEVAEAVMGNLEASALAGASS